MTRKSLFVISVLVLLVSVALLIGKARAGDAGFRSELQSAMDRLAVTFQDGGSVAVIDRNEFGSALRALEALQVGLGQILRSEGEEPLTAEEVQTISNGLATIRISVKNSIKTDSQDQVLQALADLKEQLAKQPEEASGSSPLETTTAVTGILSALATIYFGLGANARENKKLEHETAVLRAKLAALKAGKPEPDV